MEVEVEEGKKTPGSSWLPSERSQHTKRDFTPWREKKKKIDAPRTASSTFDSGGHVHRMVRPLRTFTAFYFITEY